jgi:multicomponent Na+:H+ antiporter subunit D
MFFAVDRGLRAQEPPRNMLVAMGLTAAACVAIGVFPGALYAHLPFPVDYAPYTMRHVLATLGLLGFTALGFFLLLKHLDPEPAISLDTDWFYRRGFRAPLAAARRGLVAVDGMVAEIYEVVLRRPVFGVAARLRQIDSSVIDASTVGVGHLTRAFSEALRATVSGHAQYYGLVMAAGVLIALAFAVFGR